MNTKKVTKKKMSIEDLAHSMNKGFKRVENLIEKKIDTLAVSTAKGFEAIEKRMATQEDVSKIILKEITAIHGDGKKFGENISALYSDGVGYNRKINNLTVRVEKLELKGK